MSAPFRANPLTLPPDGRQSETALAVCLGVRRLAAAHGLATVTELTLGGGRRADVVALGQDGTVWIVEVKSSIADFRADAKWPDYRAYCDHFFFAAPNGFRTEILPQDTGLILADSFGAELVRPAPEHRLSGARRKALITSFARAAAGRLHALADPHGAAGLLG